MNDRDKYGIVYSSDILVNNMLDLIPDKYYKNKYIRWFDICSGTGQFTSKLLERLLLNLSSEFNSIDECRNYILEKMIWMNEIYEPHIIELRKKFGNKANILCKDFLTLNTIEYEKFDIVLGNPPFQINGAIKTPAHKDKNKKEDGKSVYSLFTKKAFDFVYYDGLVCLVIPALWLKPDKAGLHFFLRDKMILKLHCLSTKESYKMFNKEAQVACTYFLIKNIDNNNKDDINIYDSIHNDYIKLNLIENNAIPTNYVSIINKLKMYVDEVGSLKYYKTNVGSKNYKYELKFGDKFIYKNIKTCYMDKDKPILDIIYSDIKTKYIDEIPKLILAHKRLGIPILDKKGEYGISTRDNYIISGKDYNLDELIEIQSLLSSKFIIFVFMCFNYRMSFIERYVFDYIPVITSIDNFPKLSQLKNRDEIIMDFFGLSTYEKKYIMSTIKDYNFFI